jgi:4-hydroxybenzoate polyprenyltransferase
MKTEASTFERPFAIALVLRLVVVAARPGEWIKNVALLAPLFFSHNLLDRELFTLSLVAFAYFCIASSGVYLINDICDRDGDRKHPQKRNRPIASGALPVGAAVTAAVCLFATAVFGGLLLNGPFGLIISSYVALNILYSTWLKHVVILDVFCIAVGFVLRVVAGAVVIDVEMSHWLLICTMLLALFLGFSKRRYELVNLTKDASLHRRVLTEYDPHFLDMMIGIVTSVTVVSYVFYTISNETIQRFHTDKLLLTVPFVLYGIFRFLYQVYHRNGGGNPSRTLVTDGPLLVNIILWGAACGIIVYGTIP